ncbi:hypothetical protein Ade02nite_20330 [Paractinoplanes deccanensis]|uniref:Uncharacterized protein n=1 Tax=Paractinoplanes deccanensis TaxID=113561 RepID=A0ABQ3Y084_9ACTN|nr:hypothetical protein [Actinoplanes deccanensis]GID73392.1 hypothetical protein Ade02nite_20330 [Actinoplanes deccanensis]
MTGLSDMACPSCGGRNFAVSPSGVRCLDCGWTYTVGSAARCPVEVARAEALFVSGLDAAEQPSAAQIRDAVGTELIVGCCAERMAFLYGENPERSAVRMRWCIAAVADAFTTVPA